MLTQPLVRTLSPEALAAIPTVAGYAPCCAAGAGPDLADRIAYFASDADLDDGDVPVTLESALGFLAFFGAVESPDGTESLTCSPEGGFCRSGGSRTCGASASGSWTPTP